MVNVTLPVALLLSDLNPQIHGFPLEGPFREVSLNANKPFPRHNMKPHCVAYLASPLPFVHVPCAQLCTVVSVQSKESTVVVGQ